MKITAKEMDGRSESEQGKLKHKYQYHSVKNTWHEI